MTLTEFRLLWVLDFPISPSHVLSDSRGIKGCLIISWLKLCLFWRLCWGLICFHRANALHMLHVYHRCFSPADTETSLRTVGHIHCVLPCEAAWFCLHTNPHFLHVFLEHTDLQMVLLVSLILCLQKGSLYEWCFCWFENEFYLMMVMMMTWWWWKQDDHIFITSIRWPQVIHN